jgi:SAM-dependent methyltransferase
VKGAARRVLRRAALSREAALVLQHPRWVLRHPGQILWRPQRLLRTLRDTEFLRIRAPYDGVFWLDSAGWLTTLLAAQEEIARGAPTSGYTREQRGTYADGTPWAFPPYRGAEATYWLHLPRWIATDARRLTFRRCLDVGAGYGTLSLFTHLLTGCESYLVDFNGSYMSPALAARRGFCFQLCNVELEPVPFPGPFDVVLFSEILEHLNFHPVPTLRKIADLLARGGLLYLSTPDASEWGRVGPYRSYTEMPLPHPERPIVDDHVYQYDEGELREILAAAGLRIERFDRAPGLTGHRHLNAVCVRA